MAKRRKGSAQFLKALQEVGSQYPEFAGKYAVSRVKKGRTKAAAKAEDVRCVEWGLDPVTGERICLKWEDE